MRRTVRPALLAAAVVTGMLAAGCSSTVPGAPAPAGAAAPDATPSGDAVTWIDAVCGSVVGFAKSVSAPPTLDSSSPAATVKGLSTYLGSAVASLDTATAQIKAAGPAPVAGGDAAAASITDSLTTVRASFQDAKTQIDAVDPNNLSQVAEALPKAVAPLQKLSGLPDPGNLSSTPELDAAAEKAPNCQVLKKLEG